MNKNQLFRTIDQAFTPAREIEIPELFSGRTSEIVQGLHALRSPGASVCIYGKRGVGKTSIAKQLRLVAAGLPTLTSIIQRPELFDEELFRMPTVYFSCDDAIEDAADLFRRILADRDSFAGICRYNDGIILRKTSSKSTSSAKLAARLLEATTSDEHETENIVADIDPISAFKSVTSEIVDAANTNSMIVVLDEFDRVRSKTAIASVIRTSACVKFIIVGVAEDIQSLITDHESLSRQLAEGCIKLDPMSDAMLVGILTRAQSLLKTLSFEESVMSRIVSYSSGYPHWVHLLGKWSAIDAVEKELTTVVLDNLSTALERLSKNEPGLDEIYKTVCSPSQEVEYALRVLAQGGADELSLDEMYLEARGLSRQIWDNAVAQLTNAKVLSVPRDGFVSFNNVMFKVFSKIRNPLYIANAKTRLDSYPDVLGFGVSLTDVWSKYTAIYGDVDLTKSYLIASEYVELPAQIDFTWPLEVKKKSHKPSLYDATGKPIDGIEQE
jgi:broad-specificity NMP kinase